MTKEYPAGFLAHFPKGTKINEFPKNKDGGSAMFVRLLDKKQLNATLDLIEREFPTAPAIAENGFARVFAPDGDLVFAALRKDKNFFICRFHREVFSEDTAQGVAAPEEEATHG